MLHRTALVVGTFCATLSPMTACDVLVPPSACQSSANCPFGQGCSAEGTCTFAAFDEAEISDRGPDPTEQPRPPASDCENTTLISAPELQFENDDELAAMLDGSGRCVVVDGDIEIGGDVSSLAPLAGLVEVNGTVRISDSALTDLSGLQHLRRVHVMEIENNAALLSLSGLSDTISLNEISISGNEQLISLQGLGGLAAADNVTIRKNESLENVDGLDGLTTVRDMVMLNNNKSLRGLVGLDALKNVGKALHISQNRSLPACEIRRLVDNLEGAPPSVYDEGNGTDLDNAADDMICD